MGLFWFCGVFGLIGKLFSLNSEVGVAALSSQLLWIGGLLDLFGVGVARPRDAGGKSTSAPAA
jgi:hypothetical protein